MPCSPRGGMGARSLGTSARLLWLCVSPRLGTRVLHVVCPDAETQRGNGVRGSPPSKAGLPQCQLRVWHRLRGLTTSEPLAAGQSWQGTEAQGGRLGDAVPWGQRAPTMPLQHGHGADGVVRPRRHRRARGRLAGSCPPLSLLPAAALVADTDASGAESPLPPLSFLFSFFVSFFSSPHRLILKKAQAVWAS